MDAEGAKGRKPTNLSGKRTECGAYIGAFLVSKFLLTFFFYKVSAYIRRRKTKRLSYAIVCKCLYSYLYSVICLKLITLLLRHAYHPRAGVKRKKLKNSKFKKQGTVLHHKKGEIQYVGKINLRH